MSLRLATLLLNGVLLLLIYVFLSFALRIVAGRPRQSLEPIPRVIVEKGTRPRPGTGVVLADMATLGRSPESELVLGDSFASASHARIFRRDAAYYIEDLGSTNGTFVNGRRISAPTELGLGSEIRIGDTILRYVE